MLGSSATRVSPGWISFGIPIFIVGVNLSIDGNGVRNKKSCKCKEKKPQAQFYTRPIRLEMLVTWRYLSLEGDR